LESDYLFSSQTGQQPGRVANGATRRLCRNSLDPSPLTAFKQDLVEAVSHSQRDKKIGKKNGRYQTHWMSLVGIDKGP